MKNVLNTCLATLRNNCLLACTLIACSLSAQTFQTAIGYPLPTDERGVSGLITNNGDYLLLASNTNHPSGFFNTAGDMQLVRLDAVGNLIQPNRIIGQDVGESGAWIEKAVSCNGAAGYIIAGNEQNGPASNMLLTFTNSGGSPVWVRRIGTLNDDERSVCVKQDAARNFILVGTKTDANTGIPMVHAVKTDCNGNLLWEKTYAVSNGATASSVTTFPACTASAPAMYYITGKVTPASGADEEVLILSVNASNGNVGFMKTYDVEPNANDIGTCIQGSCTLDPQQDGELWVSGYSYNPNSLNPNRKKVLLLRTDIDGTVVFGHNYDIQNSDQEFATHFQFAANDRLILTGKAEEIASSDPSETGQCLLMQVDNAGNTVDFTRVFTMGYAAQGNRVEPTAGFDFFITGHTYEMIQPNTFDYNILAIKTNKIGLTDATCYHDPATEIIVQQVLVTDVLPVIDIPQDFGGSSLMTQLYDEQQTFCKTIVQVDPCDTLGLVAAFSYTGSGYTATFSDGSSVGSGGTIIGWNWDFGDSNTSTLQNPVHLYAGAGFYTVCLIVSASSNAGIICRDTFCQEVFVKDPPVTTCEDNVVLNGGFNLGLAPGNLGSGGTIANWATWTATPQVILFDTCQDAGAVQMWGNQVVGESITQPVGFLAGTMYEVRFCGVHLPTVQDSVRIRFRASNGFPGSYLNCSGTCDEIFLSPLLTTTWNTYTSAIWVPTQNYNTLTVSIWNNFAINDGAYVSWARIDDICIRKLGVSATDDLAPAPATRVYPNPTNGALTVAFGNTLSAPAVVLVTDLLGRTVYQADIDTGATGHTLSLNHCAAGLYLVSIVRDGARIWSGRVVKE